MIRTCRLLTVLMLLMAAPSWAQSVIRDGREWLQPLDFVGLSWDEIEGVCPAPDGLCSGSLGGNDVTGYTWATIDEINALFNSYGVTPPLGPGPDMVPSFPDAVMVEFFADFAPTSDNTNERLSLGWSVDEATLPTAWTAYIGYVFADQIPPKSLTDQAFGKATTSIPGLGAWLHRRDPTSVPTMTTYGLTLTVLGLLAVATRRLSGRKYKAGLTRRK